MNQDPLEKRLREKLPAIPPRPGFETRLQAMAREPSLSKKSGLLRHLALPALALVVITFIFATREKPQATSPVVKQSPANTTPAGLEEPVSREYRGLKNDAQWTMSLFRNTLPSMPVSKKRTEE